MQRGFFMRSGFLLRQAVIDIGACQGADRLVVAEVDEIHLHLCAILDLCEGEQAVRDVDRAVFGVQDIIAHTVEQGRLFDRADDIQRRVDLIRTVAGVRAEDILRRLFEIRHRVIVVFIVLLALLEFRACEIGLDILGKAQRLAAAQREKQAERKHQRKTFFHLSLLHIIG